MRKKKVYSETQWSWQECIRIRMEALGWTQKQLAEQACCEPARVSQWLRTGQGLSWKKIEAICRELSLGLTPRHESDYSLTTRVTRLEHKLSALEAANVANVISDDRPFPRLDDDCDDFTAVG